MSRFLSDVALSDGAFALLLEMSEQLGLTHTETLELALARLKRTEREAFEEFLEAGKRAAPRGNKGL